MRANEFIFENSKNQWIPPKIDKIETTPPNQNTSRKAEETHGIRPRVERSLPATYIIPGLSGQNPYEQYRFGVAMAAAHGRKRDKADDVHPYDSESKWGQRQVVVGYAIPEIGEWIDDALNQMGMSSKKKQLMSTPESNEEIDVYTVSPIKPFRGYKK